MKKIIWLILVVFLFSTCQTEKKETIKIGAIFDLTGSLSYMGKWSEEGALLAIDDLKNDEKYKNYEIDLVIEDGETNPQKTVAAFEKLISSENIPIVIGFNSSSGLLSTAPIANERKICIFSSGAASPAITNAGKFIFRNRLSGAIEIKEIAKIAINDLHLKKMAIIYINNDYGVGYKNIFSKYYTEYGGEIVFIDAFEQDQSDFRSLITKLKSVKDIQGVYLVPYVKEGAKILKQARELNYITKWISANAIEGPELFKIAGDAAEGLIITVSKYSVKDSLSYEFNERYKDRYGRDSEMFAANTYDAVMIAVNAVIQEGNNPIKIVDYLHSLKDYPGVSGITNFDINGDVIKSISIKKVVNGKFITIN